MELDTTTAATEQSPEDAFAAEFAALVDGDTPKAEAADVPAVEAEEPVVAEAPVFAEAPVVEDIVEAAPEEDYKARIAELEAQIAAKASEPVAPQVQAAPQPVAAAPAPEVPLYTKDEEATITKYREDWPDIAQAEELVRRKEYREVVQYVFDQVTAMVAPVMSYYQNRSGKDQYSDITALVPDYDQVRDKAVAWATADTQPAYLKAAFSKVVAEGSPAEVADLIARYKKDTGFVAEQPKAVGAVQPKPQAPLSEPAKKAAAALTVVKSSRSVQSEAADPNDFDAAFAEATRAIR